MSSRKMMIAVLAVVLLSWTTTTQAQLTGDDSCIQALIPCQAFLNSTKPPAACCDPLKNAVVTQLKCLCDAFNDPGLKASFDMTEVAQLPINCGIKDAGPNMCDKVAPGPGAASGPSSAATPSTPSVPSPPPSGNGAAKNIGMAGPISGVMLLLAGSMFY